MLILFVIALLSMPITAFILKQFWLGSLFLIFFSIFGIIETISFKVTGFTVSQHVWLLPMYQRYILVIAMEIGWSALILHFLGIIKC